MDSESLAHTKWNCKYHIVFAPKYRRLVMYGRIKNETGKMLRTLCGRKDIVILEAEACPDHIHMLVTRGYVSAVQGTGTLETTGCLSISPGKKVQLPFRFRRHPRCRLQALTGLAQTTGLPVVLI